MKPVIKTDIPITPAIRSLRAAKVGFAPHLYPYLDHGGTAHAASSLGVDHHIVVKTLVMEAQGDTPRKQPLLVVMHGDREVSTKQLARLLKVKTVAPASEAAVEKYTGYLPGGVSPFGTRNRLPVYVEETVLALDRLFINGGKRGLLVEITPETLSALLAVTAVNVGLAE